MQEIEGRKAKHLALTQEAQVSKFFSQFENWQGVKWSRETQNDRRFYYEPMLSGHPEIELSQNFLGKKLGAPFWISSMTGGTKQAESINKNLAQICREFSLGMGLGSCRPLLSKWPFRANEKLFDYHLRDIIGENLPFYANLGIAQIEELLSDNKAERIFDLLDYLSTDGLIIHINPLQEWMQAEGDRFKNSPIQTLSKFFEMLFKKNKDKLFKIIVKEVGQGMGPKSLLALIELPVAGIELAGFGGTNFTLLEYLRQQEDISVLDDELKIKQVQSEIKKSLVSIGHTSFEMVEYINEYVLSGKIHAGDKDIIISGGINSILDAHFLKERLKLNSVIGKAQAYLKYAHDFNLLYSFVKSEIETYKMAKTFCIPKIND